MTFRSRPRLLHCTWRAIAAAALLGATVPVRAQGVRITGSTWVQLIDLRPLQLDSVPFTATTTDPDGNTTTLDGRIVQCPSSGGYCRLLVSGARATASPILQDVELSGWGFGEGISVHAHVRGRETFGSETVRWPRADDRFDALDAYLNVERDAYRARLGRQWTSGPLGIYNFDGAALLWRRRAWNVEGFGGSSLVAGLNESHLSGAFSEVDDLPPDERAWLIGARARWRSAGRTALSAAYQRTLRSDRGALYSERASVAASTRWAGVALDGEWTYDLITKQVNEFRLRGQRAFPHGHDAVVELRRSRPFFELWSIWGAFSPVGFDEARASVRKTSRRGRVVLDVGGAYRRYDATGDGVAALPLRDDGWRATARGTWSPRDLLTLTADYAIDVGAGASRSDGSLGAQWSTDRWSLGVAASALQSIYEYRLGIGRILGVSANGTYRLTNDTRLAGDLALYAHRLSDDALGTDWSQRRASLRLEWTVGRDAGEHERAAAPPGGRP